VVGVLECADFRVGISELADSQNLKRIGDPAYFPAFFTNDAVFEGSLCRDPRVFDPRRGCVGRSGGFGRAGSPWQWRHGCGRWCGGYCQRLCQPPHRQAPSTLPSLQYRVFLLLVSSSCRGWLPFTRGPHSFNSLSLLDGWTGGSARVRSSRTTSGPSMLRRLKIFLTGSRAHELFLLGKG